ncbi:Spermidine synthase [Sterolibacterium denitrificans]|uniref:Spermidine synthase n=1 Tax=Sterolibacterium denitrificans TaxID=157592 RepID=A0A7Z7MV08_9PROT|nr:spermidine synthase [Sterolibacterium denitrificans]SMB25338.1 Spermidine synthase [Sterolibacterium denitrificans]
MSALDHPIEISEKAGVRYLHFGSDWVQGAMRIRRPFALELAYTREMMAALLLRTEPAWPRRVLLIGLGAGSLAKFIYRNLPETCTTVVEIDERIVPIAQQYFSLPVDPQRLKLRIADGLEFIQQTRGRYDAIFVDGYNAAGRAGKLDSLEFHAACRSRLSERGLAISNLLGRSRGFHAAIERLRKAYAGRAMVFPSLDSGNAIAFAATGEPLTVTTEEMRERAHTLKSTTGLDLRSTISRLEQNQLLIGGSLVL